MPTNLTVGLLLALAVVAPASGRKSPWFRLLEWFVLYFIVGGIARGVEHKALGEIYQQEW